MTVILTDKVDLDVIDMQDRLRLAFPGLLEIRRETVRQADYTRHADSERELNPFELCCQFLGNADAEEQEILQEVINTVQEVGEMRPVKLTMQAFGSYGKLTQIDFQEPNQNLFLVTGDTGAGKTTIFDALVFAL